MRDLLETVVWGIGLLFTIYIAAAIIATLGGWIL